MRATRRGRSARRAGADVVAAAGGRRKLALAEQLGAGATADYTGAGWAGQIRAECGAIDVVFDGVGGQIGRAAFSLLREGGRFCVFGMASGALTQITEDEAERMQVTVIRGVQASPAEMGELTRSALAESAAGHLRPVIGQTFPLGRASDAHAAIESRTTMGKSLLETRLGAAQQSMGFSGRL